MGCGYYGVYIEKAYVLGEAPDVLRIAVGQRSRWCKVSTPSLYVRTACSTSYTKCCNVTQPALLSCSSHVCLPESRAHLIVVMQCQGAFQMLVSMRGLQSLFNLKSPRLIWMYVCPTAVP